jgi:phosphocarrier protein HPr
MVEKKIRITNELGLHARPSALFVKTSCAFKSEITVFKDDLEVNGKSIMSLMMLAAEHNSELVIRAEGEDEAAALAALTRLVENNFHE